jgi:nucleoside-diphosphate-sugar epimerase
MSQMTRMMIHIKPIIGFVIRRRQHVFPKHGLVEKVGDSLLDMKPKRIVLSGPSGFLGDRVLNSILSVQSHRRKYALDPGEIILLSSGPGRLMSQLTKRYNKSTLSNVRASRVDYYTQHDVGMWRDHLGSLGLKGSDSVFVNLAAVAGPQKDRPDAMLDVNYRAPVAAAKACEDLEFGHLVQSSTQATNAERAGQVCIFLPHSVPHQFKATTQIIMLTQSHSQVPYSRGKAMADFAMSNMQGLPVTIALLGLLYSKEDGLVGQSGGTLNLVDLCKLPITPIMVRHALASTTHIN